MVLTDAPADQHVLPLEVQQAPPVAEAAQRGLHLAVGQRVEDDLDAAALRHVPQAVLEGAAVAASQHVGLRQLLTKEVQGLTETLTSTNTRSATSP